MQNPNLPDHDPAAASMPAIPTYWSETIGRRVTVPDNEPEVIRERHDETERQGAWEVGARDALGQVVVALRLGVSPAQVLVVIDHLARGGTVTAVLEALRALADQAAGQ